MSHQPFVFPILRSYSFIASRVGCKLHLNTLHSHFIPYIPRFWITVLLSSYDLPYPVFLDFLQIVISFTLFRVSSSFGFITLYFRFPIHVHTTLKASAAHLYNFWPQLSCKSSRHWFLVYRVRPDLTSSTYSNPLPFTLTRYYRPFHRSIIIL